MWSGEENNLKGMVWYILGAVSNWVWCGILSHCCRCTYIYCCINFNKI